MHLYGRSADFLKLNTKIDTESAGTSGDFVSQNHKRRHYMGEKDLVQKLLEDCSDVFADIYNVLLFQSKQIIKEDDLSNTENESQYKADTGRMHEDTVVLLSHKSPDSVIYWTLHVMKKCWDCIKGYAESIWIYIPVVLGIILKRIGKSRERRIAMAKIVKETIHAKGIDIGIYTTNFENEFISLTDIAKYRNEDDPRFVI